MRQDFFLSLVHTVQTRYAQGTVLPKHRHDRLGQGAECITGLRHHPQFFAQAKQGTAQALVATGHTLLQQVMGNPQNLMRPGEVVETILAVFVGHLQPFQAPHPQVANLPHQHAAHQHANNERRVDLLITCQPEVAQGEHRQHQQGGAEQATHEPVTHPQQQRRENRPGETAVNLQRVFRGQPQAQANGQARHQQRFQPRHRATGTRREAVIHVGRIHCDHSNRRAPTSLSSTV
ncbi:hypothetical protein D3C73_808150 [compost metagenome]